ncbi:rhizobiocin [Ciceribacter sp. L1K23]|uniref:rhizobiocin n=1 Tax=Ciceribacter sp. L1K23 TaxID=2820276 RepID=UPI001B835EBC|nr:rhizobiocin [Ciceribacter sp. L1K23]MBR0558158.1 rhizobiocin [Ciceribacter sp. L1K23]
MSLTVTFGNGGASTVLDLQDTVDQAAYNLLNSDTTQEKNVSSDGGLLTSQSVSVASAGTSGSGAGGTVEIVYDSGANEFNFDVATAWNSVKNVLAVSESSDNVVFKDFVHVDVYLGGTGNSTVNVLNAKRGNIETGDGNDTVNLSLVSNDSGWVNKFNISTGAGNDTITLLQGNALSTIGGVVAAGAVNGGNGIVDGSMTTVVIDAGLGNDTIDLSAVNLKSSVVTGGKGIDTMFASSGADTFVFKLGDMAKSFVTDSITGFDIAEDKLDLVGTISDWTVTNLGGATLLTYNGSIAAHVGEKILVDGVNLTGSTDWFI